MDAKNIQFLVEKAKNDILREVKDRLPRKVGITAVNHFRQNFRDAGFRDGGIRPWQRTRRQDSKSPDAKYTPLTSRRDHLMRSIEFQAQPGQVVISDPVPYAAIHNDGGDISTHPTVTPKLRKYAWHMVYSLALKQSLAQRLNDPDDPDDKNTGNGTGSGSPYSATPTKPTEPTRPTSPILQPPFKHFSKVFQIPFEAFFRSSPERGRHRLLIDSLYYGSACPCCNSRTSRSQQYIAAPHISNAASAAISIDADVLASFLRKIYDGFDTSTQIEPSIWREVLRVINSATVEGLSQSDNHSLPDDFLAALRHSNEVFAAFKVQQMGSDMAAKLLDANGKLKTFRQWLDDVSSISTHHCGAWLRTEYDTAVIRAHNAADWQSFLRNKDVMPNLRWMPTTSPNPESSHRKFWEKKLTLPVDDPFWSKHHPGDRWNCKCSLEQTDDPVNRPDDLDGVDPPQRGLENNPGKDGHTFCDNHPYFPDGCSSCPFNRGFKNKMGTFFLNQKKHCFQCTKVDFVIPSTKNGVKKLTPQQKHEIYSMPLQKQFEKVGKNIYRHKLKATDEEDYNKLLDVAKAYSASGMKVWLLPEVHKNEVRVRKLLGLPSETKTPDMMLNRSILVDVKSPESYRKIEHNANKASKQGGIACITNHSMHLVYSKLEALSKQILNNKEYMKDEVHFYIDGTVYKYNSQGRILD